MTLPTGVTSLPLLDDGSTGSVSQGQFASVGEDCTNGAACACLGRSYATHSGDATALDSTWTRTRGLVGAALPGFLNDCALLQSAIAVQPGDGGAAFSLHVEAVDKNGHHTPWTGPLQGVLPSATFSCTGDACGCCLINAVDPTTQCRGLAGMPATGYPLGICQGL